MRLRTWWTTVVVGLLLGAPPASALSLDFEEFANGQIITSSQGVGIAVENFHVGHADLGVVYDTLANNASDWDLQRRSGWSAGNLAPATDLGNILIIQESPASCSGGFCSNPDDEGFRPAGTITFDFRAVGSFSSFAFDLVDVDGASLENGSVAFFRGGPGGTQVAFFDFASFLGLGQGVVYGDNSANHIDLGDLASFDAVVVTMGGSGGIDNLTVVPEPSTVALCSLGLAGLGAVGRRRRRR